MKGQKMDLYNLMMKRRSVWIFKDREIHESIVEQLLDGANNAPSGGNIQPFSIIFVRSIEGRKKEENKRSTTSSSPMPI
jgi:nitroreductase